MFDMNQAYFDSRDVIERIEELEAMEESALAEDATQEDVDEWGRELDAELFALRMFADSVGSSEWSNGMTFIAEGYFEDYAQELCTDLGYLPSSLPGFLASNINWVGVADDLRIDYTEYELDGNTYYSRD